MTSGMTVATAGERPVTRVNGELGSVRCRTAGSSAALEAELDDGSGVIRLVWMGQRRIPGIEPGRAVTVEGVIGVQRGRPTMFNPRYHLDAIPRQRQS
jgi:hypothetical protein